MLSSRSNSPLGDFPELPQGRSNGPIKKFERRGAEDAKSREDGLGKLNLSPEVLKFWNRISWVCSAYLCALRASALNVRVQ